ncbi:MAG: hypothetical protein JWQ76_324 [Ramlibacter sp.]|nr:hypothetical protein [Ramlibacter sp.]
MRLYYLTSLHIAKMILRERRMKLSLFNELNDPFELLGASIGDKLARRVFKTILLKHWTDTLGIICLSQTWQSPVMWAHYAAKHHGVCLGFDVPDYLAREVRYSPDRLTNMLNNNQPAAGLEQQKLEAVLTTKFADWSYEREWRVFALLQERDANGKFYVDFGSNLTLRSIVVGARCEIAVPDMAKLVLRPEKPVDVWKARPAFTEFRIVRQQRVPVLTVS